MRISAVILSYNSAKYLEQCVHSLAAAMAASDEPDEIHVVENGSVDGSADILRALEQAFPDLLKVIYMDHNTGTTVSRNAALRRAGRDTMSVILPAGREAQDTWLYADWNRARALLVPYSSSLMLERG